MIGSTFAAYRSAVGWTAAIPISLTCSNVGPPGFSRQAEGRMLHRAGGRGHRQGIRAAAESTTDGGKPNQVTGTLVANRGSRKSRPASLRVLTLRLVTGCQVSR